ncbi:MAG: electron transporter RnfD, partial [Agathobacter sp.]
YHEKAINWRNHYESFIRKLREIYPNAHIILSTTILNHHKNWDDSIEEVCRRLQDAKVHHFLYSNNGCGTHGHIRIPEAEKMAEELSAYIDSLGKDVWEDA